MIILVQFLARLLDILRSAASPSKIAAATTIALFGGLTPSLPILILSYVALIIFNVNLTAGLFALAFFRLLAWVIDPVLHSIGYLFLVQLEFIRPLWNTLYNIPFIPFTSYNNTVVMGALVTSACLAFPIYLISKKGIIVYREKYDPIIQKWPIVRFFKTSIFYQWYRYLRHIGEKLW